MQITSFGKMPGGQPVSLYVLHNRGGMQVSLTEFGAAIVRLFAPGRQGEPANVVLGFEGLQGYIEDRHFAGGIMGRYANRIAGGRFALNGRTYYLARNEGENTLHGGQAGFHKRLWKAEPLSDSAVRMTYHSRDGEEGFPGELTASVTFALEEANELRIEFAAATDRETVLNLTSHSYFNLAGAGRGDILGHELTLHAAQFTPIGPSLVPTGEMRSVDGTPFDFRTAHIIGQRIEHPDEQLQLAGGYDHNFVLAGAREKPAPAAEACDPGSGRVLEVLTTEPGLQFYSGNSLDGSGRGQSGVRYGRRSGFCLETQHYPDSPNHPQFPSTVLKPGEEFRSVTIYRFSSR